MPRTVNAEKQIGDSRQRDYWSEGGQIFFHLGLAYGTLPDGKRQCIGPEDEVQRALKENRSLGNNTLDNILIMDMNCRAEEPVKVKRARNALRKILH